MNIYSILFRMGGKGRLNWLHLAAAGAEAFSMGALTPAQSSSLCTVNDLDPATMLSVDSLKGRCIHTTDYKLLG